ncbi:ABC transporter substrate-binding protein [Corynebacterium diphtheriae bv. mitis]|uniref:Fe/B12 periplasmic-binding domain-containing protein n=1 Tax=Corynebacterium diphtheriae TaxID=1717 RepID=A0A6J4WGR0_CORDP|nr:ABC transporter substrate-binding protein [Corynebacterium diphtheriae]AEX45822.1 iron complex transport system substrate-binding protein [Corynebacterium diphtheriae INCA 402]EIK56900.1 iron complex transport system substrate-binding protein [Corynebacterium diphtheriae bv. intermedius str. NCTC 5011]OFI57706.1 iron complex transporter substrate-binding protein [Corynebacterium diphtheriae]OFI58805.1 iron complex transporter substrate-binding protein [Corynebacterium diphtheriae]OFI65288.1
MDIANFGKITGHEDTADSVVKDLDSRLDALKKAPQADKVPTAFVFDSGSDIVFTSGKFGAPQAIIEAAGGRNGAEEVEDTWTTVSWEQLAASNYEGSACGEAKSFYQLALRYVDIGCIEH